MHPDRETTGHVGALSLRGQGNCHGCSSVIGSYLYHFAPLLGLDVKYRSGFSYHNSRFVKYIKGHSITTWTRRLGKGTVC